MTFRRIVSISLSTLSKSLILCLAAASLTAPAIAQTLDDQLIKSAYDNDVLNRRIKFIQAAGEQLAQAAKGSGEAPASSSTMAVDPAVWGVFATLAGQRWKTADEVVRIFEWSSDGQELVESEIIGGLPQAKHVYMVQDNELVQHECLGTTRSCIRFATRFGTVADDGSVLFKEIIAVGKGKNPSVALRERPAAEWSTLKKKYTVIGETLIKYQLSDADKLDVTRSFSGKRTDSRAEDPWGGSIPVPTVAYSRLDDGSAPSAFAATTDFGPMEIFAGKRMISEDWHEILELQHLADGSMAIQWFSLWGQPIGRYVFVANTNGRLELLDYPYTNSPSRAMQIKAAHWLEGSKLSLKTQLEGSGYSLSHVFYLSNGKLQMDRHDIDMGKTLLGKPKLKEFSAVTRTFIPATPELLAAALEAHERKLEAQRRQAEREAQERLERQAQAERDFARFMGGLNTFARAYSDAMAESREREARQQAFLDDVRRQAEEIDRRRVAQQQASVQAPQVAVQREPVTSEVPQQMEQTRVATNVAGSSSSGGSSGEAARTSSSSNTSNSSASRLIATPEALIVCTRPDATTGKFTCATPVTARVEGGPASDQPAYRTPELLAASRKEACPDQRSLPSTTHFVWGCGFGATNNSAQMDRGAGVEVRGRRTYYCYPLETSCRRTSPE